MRSQDAGGRVSVKVDYARFARAFGGDWAARLRLVRLPACAATTPDRPECQTRIPLKTANDFKGGTLTADVDLAPASATVTESTAGMTMLAAEAGPKGSSGDYTASQMAASDSWAVGTHSGDFSWSYPLRTPPVPGGMAPKVSLAYSSAAIDGRTAENNNQASWVAGGFDSWPGSIERRYKTCADDGVTPKRGDSCWRYDNATMSLNGRVTELVRNGQGWHPKNDDGSKVEKLEDAANGDDNGEHWKVTTPDGTQYFFGLNRLPGWTSGKAETKSTWTVPVFGNDDDEPCHKSAFVDSWCQQAWRWSLDYVVDPHKNATSYWYTPETNYYQRNTTLITNGVPNGTPTVYTRGGYLNRIDYGQRSDTLFSDAPARVSFNTTERCTPTATFDCAPAKLTTANASHWPDVPFDLNCDSGKTCKDNYSATFWSRKMLESVTTQVWSGTAYKDVDVWTLKHEFLDVDYGKGAALWLDSISHSGKIGGTTATMPDLKLGGVPLDNRVDSSSLPPMSKWRISSIDNETGGSMSITYSDPDCTPGHYPKIDANARRCFPQYWSLEDSGDPPQLDWFNKYVVVLVQRLDRTGGAPVEVTKYEYKGGSAWRHDDDDGLTKEKYKTWSQWRGYSDVVVTRGDTSGQRGQSEYTYFRGMHGDQQEIEGAIRDEHVTGSDGVDVLDEEPLAGQLREEVHYTGPGGSVVDGTINDFSIVKTAQRIRPWGTVTANRVRTIKSRTRTALSAPGAWRRTEVSNTYNDDGLITMVEDLGDVLTAADDKCTRTTYAQNSAKWMLSYVSRLETVSKACNASTARPGDVVSDIRSSYDGKSWGDDPTEGEVTKTEQLDSYDGDSAKYILLSSTAYDDYGRPVEVTDRADRKTKTAYAAPNGLVAKTTLTDPAGNQSIEETDISLGQVTAKEDLNKKRTELAYDPLGRLISVWLPGRAKASQTPSLKFDYQVRKNAPTTVASSTIRNDGTYTTSYALYDGFLRQRQAQKPAPGGGRVISDVFYDSRGLTAKTNDPYYNESVPGSSLWIPASDDDVPGQTVTDFDGVGRPTTSTFRVRGNARWHTSTQYGGDRTTVTPPEGGTRTTSIVDVRGNTVQVDQWKDATHFDSVKFTHTPSGKLRTVSDAAGNTWTHHYDLRDRETSTDDPDQGTTTRVYDDKTDLLKSTTDSRNQSLYYEYDVLGRKTATYQGKDNSGTKLAEWKYDTLTGAKGQLASSTRLFNGEKYISEVLAYDDAYRPTSAQVTIPAGEGTVKGVYKTTTEFNLDGTVHRKVLPAGGAFGQGGLSSETMLYEYDELGNPTTLHGATYYVTGTRYTKLGQVQQETMSTGNKLVLATNTYQEGTNRLTRTITDRETSPTPVSNLNYRYDDAGNITQIADVPTGQTGDVQCFDYDSLRRLKTAWTALHNPTAPADTDECATRPTADNAATLLGGAAPYWQSFTHDLTGDRTAETDHDPAGDTTKDVTKSYHYPAAGQPQPHTLTSVDVQGGTRDGRTDIYGYDTTGNTTDRPGATAAQKLNWNAEGDLAKITEAGKDTTFVYDAEGAQLIRHDPDGSATLTLGNLEVRYDKTTNKTAATRYYTHAGQLVASRTTAGLTWLRADHHGTADITIDDKTQVIAHRRFTPFGQPRGTQPTTWPGEKGFVGGTINATTGLTTLGARQYDAETGRFISVDPLFDPKDPQSWNGYAYANNAPTTSSDPSGLCMRGPDCEGVTNPGQDHAQPKAPCKPGYCGNPSPPSTNHSNQDPGPHHSGGVPCNTYLVTQAGCSGGTRTPWVPQPAPLPPDYWANHLRDNYKDCFQGDFFACIGAAVETTQIATTVAPGKIKITRSERFGGRGGWFRRCSSFVPGTKVLMADGTRKAIEDIKVGDKVVATDPKTGKTQTRAVLNTITSMGYKDLVDILVQVAPGKKGAHSGLVIATDSHPFWIGGHVKKWVEAKALRPGMWLRTSAGTYTQVTATHPHPAPFQRVHNLTIANTHTYYVGAGATPILVHNAGGCPHLEMDGVPADAHPYIENVVRQMDADGTLPPGVRQGKSKVGDGIYGGEGLPAQAPRYYVETDIFPTAPGGTRPDGRLVFGLRGEIYYTRHYDDGFIQIRGPFCGC